MRLFPALAVAAFAACGPPSDRTDAKAVLPDAAAGPPQRVMTVEGFQTPESVLHDVEQDVYFVSNINGGPGAKDNNGFISRMRPDGTVDSLHFILGGRGGVTLHAPKGSAVVGDTLWVADIDAVRGFNRRTGAPIGTIAVAGSTFLNDVAAASDGTLYVTDTGIRVGASGIEPTGSDAMVVIRGRQVTRLPSTAFAPMPNGVTVNRAGSAALVVSVADPVLRTWQPGDTISSATGRGSGPGDGVEVLADGRVLISSWADSSIAVAGDSATAFISGIESPADFGVDVGRNRLLVPSFTGNRVEIWQMK